VYIDEETLSLSLKEDREEYKPEITII